MSPTQAFVPVKYDVTTLRGGLDQLTPTLALSPGACRDMQNFECAVTGGYTRIAGYERFDGHASPSDATYGMVQIVSFVNTPTFGDTLTGFTSGATGKILAVGTNYLILTAIVGTFATGEIVSVGASTIGLTTALTVSPSAEENAQYLNLAADVYRAFILPVPGSGPIRGVVSAIFSGAHKVYAFRDNAGGTACLLYEATATGWAAVTLFNSVAFTAGGTAIPADGNTLTQGANTATIKRVVLESGDWNTGTAVGRLIITTPTPGNFAAGSATIGATTLTLSGPQTSVGFLPGGKFTFDIANFYGQLSTRRIYGADGINLGFEFDGTTVVPIRTGALVDTPKHVRVHHHHLFFAIGSSLMHSGVGTPYNFTALAGAGEIAVGDTITNLLIQPGNQDSATMAIFARNSSGMLYGTSVSNFKLVSYSTATGGIHYMAQNLEQSYVLDDRGLVSFRAAQEFGNFLQATLTRHLQPFISEKQSLSMYACINRDRSQYRAFFADGTALYATIVNGEFLGAAPIQFPDPMNCAWNAELANGNEVTYLGALSGGYVYELDRGSSFDGQPIDAYLQLNWNAMKSPRTRKRFRKDSVEVQGNHFARIQFVYGLGYGTTEIAQPTVRDYFTNVGGSGQWDLSAWDAFVWDGRTLSPTEIELVGTAENIQALFSSSTDYIYPYTLNSNLIHYSMRRGVR